MSAAEGPVDLQTVAEWVEGRWAFVYAKNLLQSDDRFRRVDVQRYALAASGLPEYRSIREAIKDLIVADGPMHIGDVVDAICGDFDVEPGSVEHYAQEQPFRTVGGVVELRESSATYVRRIPDSLSLADILEGRQWRHLFFTPTGFAYRITVNADHLRGSGWGTGVVIARLVGLQQGHAWELPLDNVDATLKISRTLQRQSAFGSIKKALEAQGAQLGDIAFIRFHGKERDITGVSVTVERQGSVSRDPFAQALMLVGRDQDVDDPFDAICEAVGVDADFAAELADVATARRDDRLSAVLNEIADL